MRSLDGIETHKYFTRLLRAADSHGAEVTQILADYAAGGPLGHCREYAMARLAKLVRTGDSAFVSVFERGLSDSHCAYWSLEGLVNTLGAGCYAQLVTFALDPSHQTEHRGKAVKELAIHSGQPFLRGLPSDPYHWRADQLPLTELEDWFASGFPKGPGFHSPLRHPSLDNPVSPLDLVASRLDAKLAKSRLELQDITEPTNWLTPASATDISSVRELWPLPSFYLEFLAKFSPLRVTIRNRRYYQGLCLYGAADLIEAQVGYSHHGITKKLLAEWPSAYVVIADHAADPFVLDLSSGPLEDAPILTAMHGTGGWDFQRQAPSFLAFLKQLAR
jgi:hypothetical protein